MSKYISFKKHKKGTKDFLYLPFVLAFSLYINDKFELFEFDYSFKKKAGSVALA